MKRTSLYTLGALVMIAGSVGIYTSQPSPMAERVKELENELRQIRQENTTLKTEHEKLKTTAQAAEKKADALAQTAAKTAASKPPSGEASGNRTATSSSSGNPDTRRNSDIASLNERMLQSEISKIDITYGKLIKDLGLTGPELENFRQLLKERLTRQGEITGRMTQPGLSSQERAAISKEHIAAKKESDAAIRHFLNNEEDFKAFEYWDSTKGERGLVQSAMGSFESAGAPLTLEQRDELLALMAAIRQEAPSKRKKHGSPSLSGSQIVNGDYELDPEYLHRAAVFMSPEQVEILKNTSLKFIFRQN
jgi:hypothetical protein